MKTLQEIQQLIEFLSEACDIVCPMVLHVKTTKGKVKIVTYLFPTDKRWKRDPPHSHPGRDPGPALRQRQGDSPIGRDMSRELEGFLEVWGNDVDPSVHPEGILRLLPVGHPVIGSDLLQPEGCISKIFWIAE